MTVVRDKKIRTALRTNQIVGFVTVPAWKENKKPYFTPHKAIHSGTFSWSLTVLLSTDQLYSCDMLIYRRALFIMLDSLQNEEPEIR